MTAATIRHRVFPPVRAYQLALALALALGYAVAVTGYVAAGQVFFHDGSSSSPPPASSSSTSSSSSPNWSKPLTGVHAYSVQRGYGTSGGITCDLSVYTTNKAALDGRAKLHPGDTTATVCVVRRVNKPPTG